ncbi:hypothetical protein HMPREF1000_04098 [Parabacteroides sp. D26]|nr:hypothetical protein HMPREF1000_04098 [Parabacteroides sp. D26]
MMMCMCPGMSIIVAMKTESIDFQASSWQKN